MNALQKLKKSIVIPSRGMPVTAEDLIAIEQKMAAVVLDIDDFDILEEWLASARALEQYLRDKDLQGPMLGTQRRIEGRIGLLLGPAKPGPKQSRVVTRVTDDGARVDFRILGHALNGDCPLEYEEWRRSRRALVSLVRRRMGLIPEMAPLPVGQFRCIVADPPWQLDTGPDLWQGTIERGHDSLDYEQLSVERIKAMPIIQHAAEDSHLYLWTTNRYVEQSYDVARAWGFKPSVLLVWAKSPHGIGLGDAYRLTTEFILYARRGHLEETDICDTTWFNWPRSIHSRKPEEFYRLVESMTPAPYAELDRLEIFARYGDPEKDRPGWTVWGDESGSTQ